MTFTSPHPTARATISIKVKHFIHTFFENIMTSWYPRLFFIYRTNMPNEKSHILIFGRHLGDVEKRVVDVLAPVTQHRRHRFHLLAVQNLYIRYNSGDLDAYARLKPREHDLLLNLVNAAFKQTQTGSTDEEWFHLYLHPSATHITYILHVNLTTIPNFLKSQTSCHGRSSEYHLQQGKKSNLFIHNSHISLKRRIRGHHCLIHLLCLIPTRHFSLIHQCEKLI